MHLLGKFSGINVYMSVGGLLPNPPHHPSMILFLPQLLFHNSKPEKSKILMPRAYTISSFSNSGKSQKETVISKVFIDVKSTTTRQIPFINALFVREMMPEL